MLLVLKVFSHNNFIKMKLALICRLLLQFININLECGNNPTTFLQTYHSFIQFLNTYALLFFMSYNILVCQIFLNLFIAIILDGFDDSKQQQNTRIDDQMVKIFQREWARHDPEGTGFITLADLEDTIHIYEKFKASKTNILWNFRTSNLICGIANLIINKTNWIHGGEILLANKKQLLHFISVMELPMYNNYKHFSYYDVITRLSLTILKVDFERFLLDQESTALTVHLLPLNLQYIPL